MHSLSDPLQVLPSSLGCQVGEDVDCCQRYLFCWLFPICRSQYLANIPFRHERLWGDPSASVAFTASVGLPRESRISRASSFAISDIGSRFLDRKVAGYEDVNEWIRSRTRRSNGRESAADRSRGRNRREAEAENTRKPWIGQARRLQIVCTEEPVAGQGRPIFRRGAGFDMAQTTMARKHLHGIACLRGNWSQRDPEQKAGTKGAGKNLPRPMFPLRSASC